MSILEPVRKDIENQKQIKTHSAMIRLWHWSNTLIITGSLVTVLINSTLFEDKLLRSTVESRSLLETLEDKVWGLHIYFGYALAALFLFRIILEFFQRPKQKFFHKFKVAYQDYFILKHQRQMARRELAVKVAYIIFYVLIAILVISGLTMAFEDEIGLQRSFAHSVKEFHGFCMYLIIAFIGVHLAGVIMAERKQSKGIVSDMINGGANDA